MEERMMDTIVEIYNHMDDSDKDAFTLEDAEDMVEDQIRMDKEAGREPLAYDPQVLLRYHCGTHGAGRRVMYILPGIPGGRSCTLAACYPLHLTVICTYRKGKAPREKRKHGGFYHEKAFD